MIVDIINQSIHQNRIDDAVTGFSTLQEFIETVRASSFLKKSNEIAIILINSLGQPFSVIEPYFEALMKFVLEIGANANLDFNVRYEALTVVQWVSSLCVRHRKAAMYLEICLNSVPMKQQSRPYLTTQYAFLNSYRCFRHVLGRG
jgi:hypothetical protein